MSEWSNTTKVAIGILAWVGVAILAMVAAEYWDAFWGFFPVAAAVVVAWAVGELVMRDSDAGGKAEGGSR